MGFNVTEPKGNFIFVDFNGSGEKGKVYNLLKSEDVLIRTLNPLAQNADSE